MLPFVLGKSAQDPLRVLFLGAHCDDIEIGCGGTILQLVSTFSKLEVYWVVLSSSEIRRKEAEAGAAAFAGNVQTINVKIENFRNGFFPYHGQAIKEHFEALKGSFAPDVIFTHYRQDLHQDHRIIAELTWNTFRNHLVLEYEIPKYDGDLGQPNVYVPLTGEQLERKTDLLMSCFKSQLDKQWFTPDVFRSLARLRGIECNSPTGYAEAYFGRKLRLY